MSTDLPKNEKIIDFLIEDLKDTSTHLQATDKKTEFLFQLLMGVFVPLCVASIPILQKLLENESNKFLIVTFTIFVLLLLLLTSIIVFETVVRGYCEKIIYVNRMNYIRNKIYNTCKFKVEKNSGKFLFITKQPVSINLKSGISNAFLLFLASLFFILPLAICLFINDYILNNYINDKLGWNAYLIIISTIISLIISSILTYIMFYYRWKKSLTEVSEKINALWGEDIK